MTEICPVCAEHFTKKLRYKIECFNCNYSACCKCIQQFILLDSNMEANCMNCKIPWNDKFVYEQLTPSFFLNKYRNHIKDIVVQQQLALVPTSQLDAERILASEKLVSLRRIQNIIKKAYYKEKIVVTAQFVDDFKENLKKFIQDEYTKELKKPKNERQSKSSLNKKYLKTKPVILQENIEKINQICANTETGKKYFNLLEEIQRLEAFCNITPNEEKVSYSRPCGNNDCKGMLQSNKTLCGLCSKNTCLKCLKVYDEDEEHECNQDDLATAKLIKSDTKYCPKCNFGITKINGCDVMFCTQCKTSFHWKTLKILTKNLHNPHYIEYLRNNGTIEERNNLANNCTANPVITDFDMFRFRSIHHFCNNITHFKEYTKYANTGLKIVNRILHYIYLRDSVEQAIAENRQKNNNTRVNWILSRIERIDFESEIKKQCMNIRIYTQLQQIFETIVTVGTDLIYNYSNNELLALNTTLQNLNTEYGIVELNKKDIAFFTSKFSLSTFIEMENKISAIDTELNKVTSYCKEEAMVLAKLYKAKRIVSRFIYF